MAIVASFVFLYLKSQDPMFLVLLGIVLIGPLPSISVLARERFREAS